ncbi:hypothetical protein SULI_05590 [Saccharolobus solfataricus]|uniref:Chorismate dehydratase n=3 Tax=Saccharolobus solfataricus TaxID=2287 RepID=Q980Z4_SACS2|nr:hypothetical protein [Saccharolobus solfataricus]AAK40478.1 Hypothetical protein SSO0123 [Saccharolobus solfataricus P2]AKA73459.1 hypothetical protein SULB_1137 [Saccharolobus solfataricus]AKA76157.1 hypothetical protein SULC_1135 [Saccharolobus solfataricus]AKA78849.1 hypothetical protein SULA_1136 [Saccharolobus solfataricus]AZF67926.1 hypothetical protein SULG_05590 [Saccharolobus solfataricus]
MRLSLGYVKEKELEIIAPLLNNETNRNIEFNLIRVKEDELKFKLKELDLAFIPLPLTLFYENIRFISNGAFVANKIGLKIINSRFSKLCINSSNSTEYYLFKTLTNYKNPLEIVRSEVCNDADVLISYEDYDISLDELWRKNCGDLPLVISLIGSLRLDEQTLSKVKVVIREAASLQESRGRISHYSKELGLKGRQAIECFFQLCLKRGLCRSSISPQIL